MVHESARHALEQRKKYASWLDADDELVVANAMLIIIGRALNMLKSQIEAQGAAFEETGGFSERLTTKRIEAREKTRDPGPECPQCAKPMRRRNPPKANSGAVPRTLNAKDPADLIGFTPQKRKRPP
jgi:restriction system protein